mgnify:CR=1 FL=1
MEKKLTSIFVSVFGIKESIVNHELKIGDIPNWDSLGHLNIITAVEEEFDIYFTNDEMIELKSYQDFFDLITTKLN